MDRQPNPYENPAFTRVDQVDVDTRTDFVKKTYLHLGGAILAFVLLEAALLSSETAVGLALQLMTGRFAWLIVLGGFMLVSHVANSWAATATNPGKAYAGLGLFVVAEALIFLPLMAMARLFGPPNAIASAGLITLTVFGGLTFFVLFTGKDFSFMGRMLQVGGLIALGVILCSIVFGFNLGVIFIAAMIALASGYILYQTSAILHHYAVGQHVAAALALFASVALLFWYILQLIMSLRRG